MKETLTAVFLGGIFIAMVCGVLTGVGFLTTGLVNSFADANRTNIAELLTIGLITTLTVALIGFTCWLVGTVFISPFLFRSRAWRR